MSYVSSWTIVYTPDAIVVHWGGQSERNNLPVEVRKKEFEAEFIFYKKTLLTKDHSCYKTSRSYSG